MGGGTSTTTQGSIDPALAPLFTSSGRRLTQLQGNAPVEPFTGQYAMDVAGPNEMELYGASRYMGMDEASPLDAMALQNILRSGELAYAGPTTGQPNAADDMDLSGLLGLLNNQSRGVFPQGYGQGETPLMGPAPGPLANDPGGWGGPNPPIPRGEETDANADGSPRIPPNRRGGPGTSGDGSGYVDNVIGGEGALETRSAAANGGAPRMTPIVANGRPGTQTLPPRPTAPPPDNGGRGGNPFEGGGGGRGQIGVAGGPGPHDPAMGTLNQANAQGTTGETPFNQSPGMQAGYARVSGQQIANDPAIQAALANFQQQVQPGIQNQAALAGLGNSNAMVNSLSQAQGSMLLPLYQDAFAREQHTQDRGYGATEEELARRERSSVRRAEANQSAIDRLMALSSMQTGRRAQAAQGAMDAGSTFRDIEQGRNEAGYNDMLRRQALAETALYTPFGGMLPSAFGSRQVSTGK